MDIFKSASKMAMLITVFTLNTMALAIVLANLKDTSIFTPVIALFGNVVVSIVSFYFGVKAGSKNIPNDQK